MKKFIVSVLVLSLIFSLAACSQDTQETTAELQELSVGVLSDVDSIPLIIAQAKGYFEEEGLPIKIESFSSAKDRESALQSGNLDGAISDVLAVALAQNGGFDIKVTSLTNGSYKLLVHKDKGINSLEDLAGKSVAISTNTIIEYSTDMMLREAGLTGEDIEKTAIPQMPVRLEMLQNGKIDAATLPEPLAAVAMKNGAILLNSSDKLGINPGVLAFTSDTLNSKENEINAFYRAYNKAIEYLNNEDKSSYIDILVTDGGFPEDIKDSIILPNYTNAQLPEESNVIDVIEWLYGKELIANKYSFNELVSNKFVGE